MKATEEWLCPNCIPGHTREQRTRHLKSRPELAQVSKSSASKTSKEEEKSKNTVPEIKSTSKRDLDIQNQAETKKPKQKHEQMDHVDYFANYTRALVTREQDRTYVTDSEDVCFCCKDGGALIECDYNRKRKNKVACPKVYHTDCLGYDISEETKKWICPRHLCALCGLEEPHYVCRFCSTSYCEFQCSRKRTNNKRVRRPDFQVLGPATEDLSKGAQYICCEQCQELRQGAISRQLFDRVYGLMEQPHEQPHDDHKIKKKKPSAQVKGAAASRKSRWALDDVQECPAPAEVRGIRQSIRTATRRSLSDQSG